MMCGTRGPTTPEAGFALVLALLTLTILTFLGLTLATTTSTELQIATNFRWQKQAYYNAEAGLEAGRTLLKSLNWSSTLPAPRAVPWTPAGPGTSVAPPTSTWTPPHPKDKWKILVRTFESGACDGRGNGEGYGVVLDDGSDQGPYQNVSTIFGFTLNGAFTLWVRRPLAVADGKYFEDPAVNDVLILTSEGTAPFSGFNLAQGHDNAARVVLETVYARAAQAARCGTRSGQAGGGPEGSGFGGCGAVTGEDVAKRLGATGDGHELDETGK